MKNSLRIIISIVLCIAAAGIAYFWATALMDSVYAYKSPLHSTAPAPGEPLGKPNVRSLVFVLVDALRYDTSLDPDVMPFLNELRSNGASALMHSRPPSYSQVGYTILLTGAWPDLNDAAMINLPYEEIPIFTQDDIFSASRRAGFQTAISGFNWFERMVPQEAVSASFYTPLEDRVADQQVVDAALPWLQEGNYQLIMIHLDQVDYAGHHEGGPVDQRWDEAAARVDGLIEEIASAIDLNQDLLLVASDHGQIDQGGHGGQDAITLLEPFIMVGNGVIPGNYKDLQMVDVAPTMAAILGTNIPATNQGQVLVEMFDFSLEQVEDIHQALASQQDRLAAAYEQSIEQPVNVAASDSIVISTQAGMDSARETRLNNERIMRGVVAVLLVVLLVNLAVWQAKPFLAWMLAGVGIYLAVFNIKYILIDQMTFSLASARSASWLIGYSAVTTLIALLIGWLMVVLGTKSYRFKSQKFTITTLKFILTLLSILIIPILVHYAYNGATVSWALPDFLLSYLGLLFLIQVLVAASGGILLAGVSAFLGIFVRERQI